MNASIAQVATQDLIPVFQAEIGGVMTNACDARLLHGFLEVARDFSTWIKDRIAEYGFLLNIDYLEYSPKSGNKGKPKIEYTLSLDMGKELPMVEKNDKGRQARKYFINCERIAIETLTANTKAQYGLKSLPPSPHISEAEAQQFKKSMEAHCESNGATYPLLCRKVYDHFGVTSDKNIPRGKLEEAARLIGIKLVAAQKAALPPEPSGLSFTPDGLEGLVAERIKALPAPAPPEGGVMPKQQHNSATLNLAPLENRNPKRWLVTQARNEMVVMNALGDDVEVRTREQLIKELRQDNHVVSERTAHGVRSMVMDHLPIQVMPAILEAAATRMQRCNWQMPA